MEEKIIINIDMQGKVDAETFGITGAKCLDELDKIMKDIANECVTEKKPDFFDEKKNIDKNVKVENSW